MILLALFVPACVNKGEKKLNKPENMFFFRTLVFCIAKICLLCVAETDLKEDLSFIKVFLGFYHLFKPRHPALLARRRKSATLLPNFFRVSQL